jgi:hypothetical protein
VTPEQIEARRKGLALKLGGWLIAGAISIVALPYFVPWVWLPLLTAAFVMAAVASAVTYDWIVLNRPVRRWMVIAPCAFTLIFVAAAVFDGFLRQEYRAGDCLRWEGEMVTGLPGDRADAASAFQALKCTPSGGILDRIFGPSRVVEAKIRNGKENDKRRKDGLPPINFDE